MLYNQISRCKVKVSVNPWIYAKAVTIYVTNHLLSACLCLELGKAFHEYLYFI